LGVGNPFASDDAAFILAFSTIMLNTDLHNPQIPQAKRMTKEQFIRNNKGINDGQDLPQEYLDNLFEDIKIDQIKMDLDINDSDGAALVFTDSVLWNKMLRKSTLDQVPAAFTPTLSARHNAMTSKYRIEVVYPPGAHEKDMFVAMAQPCIGAMLAVWEVRIIFIYFFLLLLSLLFIIIILLLFLLLLLFIIIIIIFTIFYYYLLFLCDLCDL
jgi:sensor histidine kinase YesM